MNKFKIKVMRKIEIDKSLLIRHLLAGRCLNLRNALKKCDRMDLHAKVQKVIKQINADEYDAVLETTKECFEFGSLGQNQVRHDHIIKRDAKAIEEIAQKIKENYEEIVAKYK